MLNPKEDSNEIRNTFYRFLVLTQDGLLRADNKWMFVKYDKRGRTVMQGLYRNTAQTTRSGMQLLVDGLYTTANALFPFNAWYETKSTALHGYTNISFPKLNSDDTPLEVLNVNYYDSYDFDHDGTDDFGYAPQGLTGEASAITAVTGLSTGSKRLVIGSTKWLYNYVFYDKYYRTIQVRSNNHRDAIIDDLVTNVYDFEGKLRTSRTSRDEAPDIVNSYEYDDKGRIREIYGKSPAAVPLSWTSLTGVVANGGTVTKTAGSNWDAGAISTTSLAANQDGWVEFSAGEATAKMLGLASQNSNAHYASIGFAIYADLANKIRIYESGTARGEFGTYTSTDMLKVERRKGRIYYWKNDQLLYTSTLGATGVLYVDCSIYTLNSYIDQVSLFKPEDLILAQYEYNELGQVVDKKLHHTTGTDLLQSVDYRYTLQGQISSINNSKLTADDDLNDDTGDHFGMELLCNDIEAGLNNDAHFNGSIAAVKWKGAGALAGADDQKSYKYDYDRAGKLKSATFQMRSGSDWTREAGVHNEVMGYDHNGNIASLQRSQRKHQLDGVIASYTQELMDNLTYTYNSTSGDRLQKVEDAATGRGFDNGSSGTSTDYAYDDNGNLTADRNKGIDSIHYNFLGKVRRIKFTDGRVVTYGYDAGGTKLAMKTYPAGSTTPAFTEYVNGFVYENGALKFYGSPEGRVVMNGNVPEYEYAIADHQGNTRVVFTSAEPEVEAPATDFESDPGTLYNFPTGGNHSDLPLFNQTPGGTYSNLLNGGHNSQVGIGRKFKVYPGDKVKIQAYAKYEAGGSSTSGAFALALLSAFNLPAPGGGETGTPSSGLNEWGQLIDGGIQDGGTAPQAFVNIVIFDKDHNFLDAVWDQVHADAEQDGETPDVPHDEMVGEYTITEEGHVYLYISNNSPVNVYFDDVTITHTPTNVIQYNEYYPFGLQASTSWTRENHKNDYLYNEANELNQTSGWYETFFRGYDPALGRFLQVDPLATMYASYSGYNYALNDPVLMNDPLGAQAEPVQPCDNCLIGMDIPGRIGPGSGNHWTDGSAYSDWSVNGGSQTYRDGLAAGMSDIGGVLYARTSQGYIRGESKNGEWGYHETYVTGTGYHDVTFGERFVSVAKRGGWPDIGDLVNPLSFNLKDLFGRYLTYADYEETFAIVGNLSNLRVYDQLNLKINKIALSVSGERGDPKILFTLAQIFNEARLRVYREWEERDIFNLMTDAEGEALFMRYLNERLQVYFPSPTETFARRNHPILWVGDIPNSKITFIGPFIKPN